MWLPDKRLENPALDQTKKIHKPHNTIWKKVAGNVTFLKLDFYIMADAIFAKFWPCS